MHPETNYHEVIRSIISLFTIAPFSLRDKETLEAGQKAGESAARGPKAGRDATFIVAVRDARGVASPL